MLSFTGPAVEAIRALITAPGEPAESGLRISHQDTAGSLSLSIAPAPQAGDRVIETDGVRVFLETEAASMLEGKALDALVDESGVAFQVATPE
jgi:Fe-S cluster assembly iron-binding protein IscA